MKKSVNRSKNQPLLIFRPGKQALEEFEGKDAVIRGIKRRFRHDIEGVSIHYAELLVQLQEGHKHTTSHEAIMLLDGEIKACCWDKEGRIETESLSECGDLVVFSPDQSHALFVKQDTHIIVVRFFPKNKVQEAGERIAVPLPGKLESLRRKALDTRYPVKEILQQIDQEIERNEK